MTLTHQNVCSLTASGSSSKPKVIHRTSHSPSRQDTDLDEPELMTTEAPVEPTTPSQSNPVESAKKRQRPLSQSRSYHDTFFSARGSSRNSRDFSRGKVTTPPPVEETTTAMMVPEAKEPDNDVSPEVEEEELHTTETPNLKILTPSPTKQTYGKPNSKPRRPIKIRVHKKPSSSPFPFISSTSSSHSPLASTSSPSHIQESAARREDYTASTYSKNKDLVGKEIPSYKPPSPAEKENSSQQPEVAQTSRSTGPGGRFGYGTRNGFSRRRPGVMLRGNSTRILNGYKPATIPQSNLPNRAANSATLNAHTSSVSQFPVPERTNNEAKSDTNNGHRRQTSFHSRSQSSIPVTSQSTPQHPFRSTTSHSSPSVSHRGSQRTTNSHTPSEVGRTYSRGNDDMKPESTNTELKNIEEPTITSKLQPTEEGSKSPSLAERFPWLASRYPEQFAPRTRTLASQQDGRSPLTRTSSSVGVFRPFLRGTTPRVSGATGASGVSPIQETNEDLKSPSNRDSIKSGVGVSVVKPSLADKNPASGETRKTTTSASSSVASTSHHTSHGPTGSSERIHEKPTYGNQNSHKKDYVEEVSRNVGKNDEDTDSTEAEKPPIVTSANADRNTEENESVNTRETFSGTRTGTSVGVPPTQRRPAVGTSPRAHSPFLANRQFRPRVPIRPQPAQNTRSGSSTSQSSSSSVDSSSSHNEAGTQPSERKTGTVAEGQSQSTSSSSSSSTASLSSRDTTRGAGVRARYPISRGKPNNGGTFKPANGNGNVSIKP